MNTAVHFQNINVRCMPGFPKGKLVLDGLATGVNIIYGPNASGKTTLSRALRRVLRTSGVERDTTSLVSDLSIDGQVYHVDLHLGNRICQTGGAETAFPLQVTREVCDRCELALHELVQQEDERQIVEQILREAAGGYDLAAAASQLGFDRSRPRTRIIKEVAAYKDATVTCSNAERRLLEIDRQAGRLSTLEEERRIAHDAQLRVRRIEEALDALEKTGALEEARKKLQEFPQAMSKLAGDEWETLKELKKKIGDCKLARNQANHRLDAAQVAMAETDLPMGGVARDIVTTLEERCETLKDHVVEIERVEREITKLRQKRSDVQTRLEPGLEVERAASLDGAALQQLFKFVRKAEDFQIQAKVADTLAGWLNTDSGSDTDPEQLREGILLLQQWLAAQRLERQAGARRALWLSAAGITALCGLLMALFFHFSWLLLLLPAAGMAAWPWLRSHLVVTANPSAEAREKWTGLALAEPADWNLAGVQGALLNYQKEWATVLVSQEKKQRFAEVVGWRAEHQDQRMEIEKLRQRWRAELGLEIELEDARLYLLAESLQKAWEVDGEINQQQVDLGRVRRLHNDLLQTINAELASYVAAPAVDASQAAGFVRGLETRRGQYEEACSSKKQAEKDIRESDKQIEELESKVSLLFTELGLPTDDEVTLRSWCEQHKTYRQAREALRLAEHDADAALAKLTDYGELLEQTDEQLEKKLVDCQELAQSLERLDQEIGDIKGRVREAKEETALEAALAEKEGRLEDLSAAQDDDAGRLLGNVLVEYLGKQQRDIEQPGVLQRAAELFTHITQGRYRLQIRPGEDIPGFTAVETADDKEKGLGELSSGTRLQLLLAVRVAYVEQQEQGVMLPLIFDETLGNSDEQRANRIIQAAVEIAQEGRQIFYFTAQHDELAKWRRVLQQRNDVPRSEFDLAKLRGFSELEHAPEMFELEIPRPTPVPPPDGDDWWEYGRRLRVPPLDHRGHLGGAHLWYFVDDVQELYRLLTNDINRWGQLVTLVELGDTHGLDAESLAFRRAVASAKLLEKLIGLWLQGRGKPVDQGVLLESGWVTDAFIDQVTQLADSLQGDARQLIYELRDGSVPRFRAASIDGLESYFEAEGYLDNDPILPAYEIRNRVMPLVFADCESGLLNRNRIDRLIALVAEGISPES